MPAERVVAVIPSRLASTRLPEKPLADIHGKPMVQWVYERARAAAGVDEVIVATDSERVAQAVRRFGGRVELTDPAIPSGTDRVAAVADLVAGEIFVNVQGDEPLMASEAIAAAVALVRERRFEIGTAAVPFRDVAELDDPAAVKALVDRDRRGLYFSRHPVPYSRGERPARAADLACERHVGLYVYRRETLARFRSLPVSPWERGELLEQLRALEAGISIGVARADFLSIGVDTPADLEKARRALAP